MNPPAAVSGRTIACLSTSIWRGLWTRKQWTMRAFARSNRVVYVDPQESFTYRLRIGPHRRRVPQAMIPPGVRVISPWPALPLGQDRWLCQRVNQALLWLQLRKALGAPPDVWWVYDPVAWPVVERFPAKLLVYDCVDRHAAYGGYRRLMDALERRLIGRADVVFVTARGLLDHCRPARELHFVSNGFDEEMFRQPSPCPPRLARIPRPRLGFIGGLAHWVDVDLLLRVASARPDWSVVLVGPVADVRGVRPEAPNVFWLGPCRREEVPGYICGFDVGLVPFRDIPLTRTVNPLKAYEYLAAGIPVVATRMPELDHLPVRQATSPEAFVAAIEEALAEGPSEVAWRKEAVAPYSLQQGFAFMSALLAERLA